jgi:hypothetical protein
MPGSFSHLTSQGIVSYTEDLLTFLSSLGDKVGPRVRRSHMCQFHWEIDSPEHIRDVFRLDSWIMSFDLGRGVLLRESQEAPWRMIGGRGWWRCVSGTFQGSALLLTMQPEQSQKKPFHFLVVLSPCQKNSATWPGSGEGNFGCSTVIADLNTNFRS